MTIALKRKGKIALIVISVILSLVSLVATIVGFSNLATTRTIKATDYAIGTINETGNIVDSKKSTYLKDMVTIEDMEITIDEDAQITYKLVFYDEEEKYISTTESLAKDYDVSTTPENAKYFRVVITPNQVDEEDVKLNFFNVRKYTNMLEIKIAK